MTIIVYKKDGTRFERNNLISCSCSLGNLVMIFPGICGGYETEVIGKTVIKKYEVIYD